MGPSNIKKNEKFDLDQPLMKAISDIINNPEDPRWRAPEAPQIGIEKICLEDPWGPDPNWFEKEMKDSVGTRPICYVTGPTYIKKWGTNAGPKFWDQLNLTQDIII